MKEHIELLERVSSLLKFSGEPTITNAVYISPAQSLRNAADSIEKKDTTVREFRELIRKLKESE